MKKIGYIINSGIISGGINVVFEHASAIKAAGFDVYILSENEILKEDVSWHHKSSNLKFITFKAAQSKLFSIVFATWWGTVFDLGKVNAERYGFFCQSIESRFYNHEDIVSKYLNEFTYRLPLYIYTEADWIRDYLKENYNKEVPVIPNGLDKGIFTLKGETYEPRNPDKIRVLVEGSFNAPFKQTARSIELCKKAGIDDIWLLTSTEMRYYPGVCRVYSQIAIENVPKVYRSCDVLLKLSKVEGMFGPPLEMMHSGGTAITYDVTGSEMYMKNNYNGIVVPMGDESQIIRALKLLKNDKQYLESLKKGAIETASNWPSWHQVSKKLIRFINKTLSDDLTVYRRNSSLEMIKAGNYLMGPLYCEVMKKHQGGIKHAAKILIYDFINLLKIIRNKVLSKNALLKKD